MNNKLFLIRVPIFVEYFIQLKYLIRISAREKKHTASSRRPIRWRRWQKPVVRPRLDANFAIIWRQHMFLALNFITQPTLEHLHVFVLRRMEMQRRLLVLQLYEARVVKLKNTFEYVITAFWNLMCGKGTRGDGALKAA